MRKRMRTAFPRYKKEFTPLGMSKMSSRKVKSLKGLTLMELIVYLAVWMTVSSLIFSIYYKCIHVTRKANDYIDTLQTIRLISGKIERDIRSASYVLSAIDNFTSGEKTLILEIFPIREEIPHYIIYHFDGDEGSNLKRTIIDTANTHNTTHLFTEDILEDVKFVIEGETARPLITVELTLRKGAFKKASQTIFDFSASLRNTKKEIY